MADPTRTKEMAGQSFHVRDCYVWAEIFYLDSPTDYREYLPQNHKKPLAGQGKFVMLDNATPTSGEMLKSLWVAVLAVFIIAGYFLYLIIENF